METLCCRAAPTGSDSTQRPNSRRLSWAAYLELTKPRITALIVFSTAVGFFFGMPHHYLWTAVGIRCLVHAMAATALLASGTASLNQWWEAAADAQMRRTARRPISSGRISSRNALAFGLGISLLGFLDLAFNVNWISAWLGLFTLASYLLLYTPLKRRSPLSTTIGAVPGAMPPLIGFAAAHGSLAPGAYALAAILFLWQFPHFYAIAWMYRDDYARGGMRLLPVLRAGLPLNGSTHGAVWLGAGPGEFDPASARHEWSSLCRRSGPSWSMVLTIRRPSGPAANHRIGA